MASKLKTGWKRIGRSGDTVDGRVISTHAIRQAADNYNKELWTALIWPDHSRWFNLGKVEALRAEDNDEGGADLFAVLAPNEYYQSINKYGQRLFTSMELSLDFRKTGEAYLYGLGATDNPASVATEEVRFSRIDEKDTLLSLHTENTTHEFLEDPFLEDQPPGWFTRLFSTSQKEHEDAMSDQINKQALEQLQGELTALGEKFDQAFAKDKPADADANKDKPADQFAALQTQVTELVENFKNLEAKIGSDDSDDKANDKNSQYQELKTALEDLTTKFTAALGEQTPTDAGEDTGGDDLNQYI